MSLLKQFRKACDGGSLETVRKIIAREEFDINQGRERFGYGEETTLYMAMNSKNIEIVEYLLAQPSLKLDTYGHYGRTALYSSSNVECLELFLKDERCTPEIVNMEDDDGNTALSYHISVESAPTIVQLLLSYPGVDVNIGSREGMTTNHTTPLLHAIKGEPEMVSLVLGHPDTKLDVVDEELYNVVMTACEKNKVDNLKLLMADKRWDPELVNYDNGRGNFNNSALIIATHDQCNVEILKMLLEQPGVDVNITDHREGRTPLLHAASQGNVEIFRLLLEHPNTKLDVSDNKGRTAVILACMAKSAECIKLLIEDKRWDSSSVNLNSEYNETPLVLAAHENCSEITRMLLAQQNIDVNIKLTRGTALHCAMCNGNIDIVKMLLAHEDIKLDVVDSNDRNALNYASVDTEKFSNEDNVECVKLFLKDQRCNADVVNHVGFGESSSPVLHQAASRGHTEIVRMLLDYPGINAHFVDEDGNTPLLLAARGAHHEILRMLLANKDTVMNKINNGGNTALFLATKADKDVEQIKKCVNILLADEQCTVDYIDKQDENGNIPLLYAAQLLPEVAKIILQKPGIDINKTDSQGRSPLYYAMDNNNPEVVRMLLAQENLEIENLDDCNRSVLMGAVNQQHVDCVRIFLSDQRCNASIVNQKDDMGNSALMFAIMNTNSVIVRMILNFSGADPNITDSYGYTPLMHIMSVDQNNYEVENILKLLLKNKKTKLDCTVEGRTALDQSSNDKNIKLFTADPRCTAELLNHKDQDTGDTYLTKAVKSGKIEIVKVFVNHPYMDCNAGNPLVYAMLENLPDILSLLLNNKTIEFDVGDALITACHRNYYQIVKQVTQDQRCTRDILNHQNMLGETALMTAVAYEHTEILQLLVSLPGIDFSLKNIAGETAMDLAKRSFYETCARILEEKQSG